MRASRSFVSAAAAAIAARALSVSAWLASACACAAFTARSSAALCAARCCAASARASAATERYQRNLHPSRAATASTASASAPYFQALARRLDRITARARRAAATPGSDRRRGWGGSCRQPANFNSVTCFPRIARTPRARRHAAAPAPGTPGRRHISIGPTAHRSPASCRPVQASRAWIRRPHGGRR
jgi:hypothetical protein